MLESVPRGVVNACSTPFGINGTNSCLFRSQSWPLGRCAQRLSASTEQTEVLSWNNEIHLHVLNAFRHQRNKQKQREALDRVYEACSTPFGINGTNSDQTPIGPKRVKVLNAFRHQRNKQVCVVFNCPVVLLCSTPFGINGTNSYPIASPMKPA